MQPQSNSTAMQTQQPQQVQSNTSGNSQGKALSPRLKDQADVRCTSTLRTERAGDGGKRLTLSLGNADVAYGSNLTVCAWPFS